MASFDDHISQAKGNLTFLTGVNLNFNSNWDWQVTICFYVAVHLMNGHLAKKANLHYRTHNDVKNGINPHNPTAVYKVPEDIYQDVLVIYAMKKLRQVQKGKLMLLMTSILPKQLKIWIKY